MKKHFRILTVAMMACLLSAALIYSGCKKAQLQQTNSDYGQLIAAQDYSNNELVRLIKLTDPPLSDHELMGIMIAASPLDDNIIKELLKRGQPPCSCALSNETLQMILLFNLPLSDHILKEMEKYGIQLSRSLLDNIHLTDLPDMELEKANQLMESLLNLKFGDGESDYHLIEMVRDTVEVYGTLESGKYFVLAQEFITSMEEMDLRCKSASDEVTIPCISKHIRAVDLDITTSLTPDGNKVFRIAFTPVVAVVTVVLPKCSFDPIIDYWWWWDGGVCSGGYAPPSPLVGQLPCFDAARRIEGVANYTNTPTLVCGAFSSCSFFTNISTLYMPTPTANPNDPTPFGDCICDWLGFFEIVGTCANSVVTPLEMQCHLDGARYYATTNLPVGQQIVSYDLEGDLVPGGNPILLHYVRINYGTCSGIPL